MPASISTSAIGKESIVFSHGELAKLANGAILASYGDNVVLVTACISSEPKQYEGFVPLTVEYQEKTYAVGKIPGGFIKREGKPKDTEILSARLIDRSIRPLFGDGLLNEVQVIAMVLSSDGKNDPDVLSVNAASCTLLVSDIPFSNPIGAVRVGKIENNIILNPTYEEREKSSVDLVVVGTDDKIVMLEGLFSEVPEDELLELIKFSHPYIKDIIKAQRELQKIVNKTKKNFKFYEINKELYNLILEKVKSNLENIYGICDKAAREEELNKVLNSLYEEIKSYNDKFTFQEVKEVFYKIEDEFMREKILNEEKRPDSRSLNQIRPIDCKIRVLPRTHGSALFTRGQTQSLVITTLGTSADEQLIEALEGEKTKHFMLHYSFPPFSVGEIKPLRAPSRREIGHGMLAEKSLSKVIPSKEEFPYTIRVVSEILESNGSSSMATVCAASLSLMDAGVPIKSPVAGIAIGLVTGKDKYKILTDIAGIEDHYGDMDFKIAGTRQGITACQLDVKILGIDYKIIYEALLAAKDARNFILDKMQETILKPRDGISEYAPKIKTFKVDPEKIGNIIGPGGKIIRKLIRENNVRIDIDDENGVVSVVAEDFKDLDRTVNQILALTKDIEIGEIYEVKVIKITNFGAFCEIVPGKVGLVHISEISNKYVKDIRDFLKEGDIIKAKILNIDHQGKITLTLKNL